MDFIAYILAKKAGSKEIPKAVTEWLEENITQETGYVIDDSLTVEGAAADAKAVGQAIAACGSGWSTAAMVLLLEILRRCGWKSEGTAAYVDALETELFPQTSLVSISAVFTQGSTVIYDTDPIDSLKTMLVVTALYDDQTTETITNYTLSGTLLPGTSTITVSYGGKTTTFDVEVTENNVLYIITGDRLDRNTSNQTAYPYKTANNKMRMVYTKFDLSVTGGQRFRFTATSTYNTAQMSAQFFNETALAAVASDQNINTDDMLDSGWQNLTFEIDVPETYNGSNVVCFRLNFRQASNNPTISDDFIISQILVERVPASA